MRQKQTSCLYQLSGLKSELSRLSVVSKLHPDPLLLTFIRAREQASCVKAIGPRDFCARSETIQRAMRVVNPRSKGIADNLIPG